MDLNKCKEWFRRLRKEPEAMDGNGAPGLEKISRCLLQVRRSSERVTVIGDFFRQKVFLHWYCKTGTVEPGRLYFAHGLSPPAMVLLAMPGVGQLFSAACD